MASEPVAIVAEIAEADAVVAETPVVAEAVVIEAIADAAAAADDVAAQAAIAEDSPEDDSEPAVSFYDLGVPRRLVSALDREGITARSRSRPPRCRTRCAGRDVLGRGQTGSGKTLAFGLPMLVRIAASGRLRPRQPKALVLVPTRELAMQVTDVLTPCARRSACSAAPRSAARRTTGRSVRSRAASTSSSRPRAGSGT